MVEAQQSALSGFTRAVLFGHNRMVCRFPSASGFGRILKLQNQAMLTSFRQGSVVVDSIRLRLSTVSVISPSIHPTTGFNLTIQEKNLAQYQVLMRWRGTNCSHRE